MPRSKKIEPTLKQIIVIVHDKEIALQASDITFDSAESLCDLCGSHGFVNVEFKCPLCGHDHEIELKHW